MKKTILSFIFFIALNSFAQQQNVTYSVNPSVFEEDDSITLSFEGSSINEATWGVTGNELYLWSWSYDLNLTNQEDCPTNGDWTNSNELNKLTYNGGTDTYSITFIPSAFYNRSSIGRIGFLIKAKDGSGDKKSQDILVDVGAFQVSLTAPTVSTSILNSGDDLTISATNTGGNADYVLKANGLTINTQLNTTSYSYTDTNLTSNKNYSLEITIGGDTKTKEFSILIDPGNNFSVMPQTYLDGITYDETDSTKATLVLYATGKDFVYVAGSFNNWEPDTNYAMKRDPSRNNKFWITLTGLTPGQIETFQYWVVDKSPIANSPSLVKTADPYSTLVLSPFDDSGIPSGSYPNLPAYPIGQEREVTVLQTNQASYNWQVTNFMKPKKEDLIIYEVLVRDFDADRNFQDIIDKISYFKNLNINAIELMPIMEFEGNESWGYNTAFHMALDKFYGTEDKFKELVDVCHQNGIAVILDIALNHAFGRNPMVRMWMDDADGDGWGGPSSENPYFNTTAKHTYSVGYDFNHSNSFTKVYTKRVVEHWIEEFKIDGFRWDLTKGFTQNCSSGDENCTNSYQADRVAVLKEYADYSWSLDETHYVIFEHLGTSGEEQEWANYRLGDATPKGVMMWGKMTNPYTVISRGYSVDPDANFPTYNCNFGNGDISGVGHKSRGFTEKRLIGYAESHDEERLMYYTMINGNSNGNDATLFESRTKRMSAIGAVLFTIPGPKMMWHFGELAMENSIFTRNDGIVNLPDNPCNYGDDGSISGENKLDTKPQPQWINNWTSDLNRNQVYTDWSRINELKINEEVFEGDYTISPEGGDYTKQRIYIFNDDLPVSNLKNVVILANFDIVGQNISPNFPFEGTWYDLMDESGGSTIDGNTTSINIESGGFRIYGNQIATLSTKNIDFSTNISLYPNPSTNSFKINKAVETVSIYSITGKAVKLFKGGFDKGYSFNISNLPQSLYLVKIKSDSGAQQTLKMIKL
ncbi:alpha-amylase family glycosyl hydrolase [Seonamhaeicola sp. MEBiC1930]|uniref:alpha-amylase family glycosyl hydrolase n=1 Tax=Seonamhaeicola sp. MEBiC01930 TaxID=2976768 RepID=UPI0032459188